MLAQAIQGAISELVCDQFAYAERYDEDTGRYEGLKMTGGGSVIIDSMTVVVQLDVAEAQSSVSEIQPAESESEADEKSKSDAQSSELELPKRFFATIDIDPDRAACDMGKIAEEVLQHLTVLPKSKMRVTIEIDAEVPEGVAEDTQRVLTENCQTLRFKDHGFEVE